MQLLGLSQQEIEQAIFQHGTPLYLYNLDIVESRYQALTENLPSNCRVYYALKANSNLTICHRLSQLGAAAEVSSLGEFIAALKSGFLANSIVFTGPGKTDGELLTAIAKGVGLIVVESVNEARRVNEIAKQQEICQDVLLRINPCFRTLNSCEVRACSIDETSVLKPIQMNGQGSSKFGVDEEESLEAIAAFTSLKHLQLKGVHVFTESNVLNYAHLLDAWRNTIEIASRLRQAGHPISVLDFGGGIGVPYNSVDHAFDMVSFGRELTELFERSPYPYTCILEIGRYIVCEAGCYVAEVVDVKQSKGQKIVVVNGGVHHIYRTPAMQNASKYLQVLGKDTEVQQSAALVGQLPTPIDILVKDVQLPATIAVGDVVAIANCGAYGFNHSLTNFALHPYPAEAAYLGGRLELVRSRGSIEDFFVHQHLITV
jgi:diaminopimelate decarboxylase